MAPSSVYSCDDHFDLRAVPPDLWDARLPKDQAGPRVVMREGEPTWLCNDRVLGRRGLPPGTSTLRDISAIGRAGIEDDGFHASNPKLRLEDMDRDGIRGSVIYGPVPLTLSIPEPELQNACYAAWNDWAVEEFNAAAPERLCVLPFLPSHSPEAAVLELERYAGIGHRGQLSTSSSSTRAIHPGIGCGPPPPAPNCRSASTSRPAPPRGSAIRSANGSRRRSPRCSRYSWTRHLPSWSSPVRWNGIRPSSSCWRNRALAGCRRTT